MEYEYKCKSFFLEITNIIEPKLFINGHWMVPYKAGIFMLSGLITNMTVKTELDFNIGSNSIGKWIKSFVFEIKNMIEPKLYMNGHWMVSCKVGIFMWTRKPRCPLLQDKFNIGSFGGKYWMKIILIWNHWIIWQQTLLECTLVVHSLNVSFLRQFEIKFGYRCRPKLRCYHHETFL